MKIEIIRNDGGSFFVGIDDKFEDELSPDEALMVVSTAIISPKQRIPYLKTQAEHDLQFEKHGWRKVIDIRKQ